eukprot:1387921-Pyramimonas_sp.AAC.1
MMMMMMIPCSLHASCGNLQGHDAPRPLAPDLSPPAVRPPPASPTTAPFPHLPVLPIPSRSFKDCRSHNGS